MVLVSLFVSLVIGGPIGVLLATTREGELFEAPLFHAHGASCQCDPIYPFHYFGSGHYSVYPFGCRNIYWNNGGDCPLDGRGNSFSWRALLKAQYVTLIAGLWKRLMLWGRILGRLY